MQVEWKGVMPAVTTKFDDDDNLDLVTFEKNIKAQIDAGVNGIILGGTLGEASTLTTDEKETLIRKTLEIVQEEVPVIINIAEQSTKDAIAVAKRAEEIGAQGLMLLPPMRYKATDHETVTYFKEIARSTSLPIMIYNRLRNEFGDRLKILTGVDTLAFESMVSGADGWVAGLVAAYPAETVAIYKLTRAGKVDEALEIYRWFMPLLELDISPQLVQNIKLAEVSTGLGTENVRAPRLPLEGEERERVQSIIREANEKRPELPEYKHL